MILLIDGYNVLKSIFGGYHIDESSRAVFIQDLARYVLKKGHSVMLVFDGGPHQKPERTVERGIQVIYVGTRITADEYIRDYVEKFYEKDILLITSDRAVCIWCKRFGIPSLDSDIFYRLLESDSALGNLEAKNTGHVIKTTKNDDASIDLLMKEAARYVVPKDEELAPSKDRKGTALKLSKKDLLIEKKLKKLLK